MINLKTQDVSPRLKIKPFFLCVVNSEIYFFCSHRIISPQQGKHLQTKCIFWVRIEFFMLLTTSDVLMRTKKAFSLLRFSCAAPETKMRKSARSRWYNLQIFSPRLCARRKNGHWAVISSLLHVDRKHNVITTSRTMEPRTKARRQYFPLGVQKPAFMFLMGSLSNLFFFKETPTFYIKILLGWIFIYHFYI